jgi:hypothetical protein
MCMYTEYYLPQHKPGHLSKMQFPRPIPRSVWEYQVLCSEKEPQVVPVFPEAEPRWGDLWETASGGACIHSVESIGTLDTTPMQSHVEEQRWWLLVQSEGLQRVPKSTVVPPVAQVSSPQIFQLPGNRWETAGGYQAACPQVKKTRTPGIPWKCQSLCLWSSWQEV